VAMRKSQLRLGAKKTVALKKLLLANDRSFVLRTAASVNCVPYTGVMTALLRPGCALGEQPGGKLSG